MPTPALADRAFGSLAGSSIACSFGVRFINDTASLQSNIVDSCVGEQWRAGSSATPTTLAFSWRVSDTPITKSFSAANWSNFPALNFFSPNLSAAEAGPDGNGATNRSLFSSVALVGVVLNPGQELFLRWRDVDDIAQSNPFLTLQWESVFVASRIAWTHPPTSRPGVCSPQI